MTPHKTSIGRRPIVPDRLRRIDGGFSYIPNRFLQGGFFASLSRNELLLYFLLVLAGDRSGLSFYHYDSICSLLGITLERYIEARNGLIDKDLIAFDGSRYQVLSLPEEVHNQQQLALETDEDMQARDPATIRLALQRVLHPDEDFES